jgi:hypothetical protein
MDETLKYERIEVRTCWLYRMCRLTVHGCICMIASIKTNHPLQ